MPYGANEFAQGISVQFPDRAGFKIKMPNVDVGDGFGLCHAVFREAELTCPRFMYQLL